MIKDLNAGITKIAYNFLNLPQEIIKGGKTIKYIYTATGEKLQNIFPNKTITYCGRFVYKGNVLSYIQTEDGRYIASGGSYEYNLTDHLGNVRMVLNGKGEIVQTSNYYPFGMRFGISGGSDNKNLYSGKELQEETDWLDFGARMYDSSIGRWMCADPMAEKACDWTPYRYCFNNPMNMIDPNGLYEWDYDMGSNNISYVGDMGGNNWQYVNNFYGINYLNTAIMGNTEFENVFGFDPLKEKLGDEVPIMNDTFMYDNLIIGDMVLYSSGENYFGKYSISGIGDVSFQHEYTKGWYMSFEGVPSEGGVRIKGKFNIHNVKGEIISSIDATSGSNFYKKGSRYPLPEGSFYANNLKYRSEKAYNRHRIGYSLDLYPNPVFDTTCDILRTNFRVHPCGNGTLGCVGLQGTRFELLSISILLGTYYINNGATTLKVNYK